jgi:NADP-dependent 3-hydroxy acid dehydrogenase YdfG
MSGIEGKVVAITGASSGIGEAAALLLAERGAAVVLGARRVDRLDALADGIRDRGGRAASLSVDVTRREDLERLVDLAVGSSGASTCWSATPGSARSARWRTWTSTAGRR